MLEISVSTHYPLDSFNVWNLYINQIISDIFTHPYTHLFGVVFLAVQHLLFNRSLANKMIYLCLLGTCVCVFGDFLIYLVILYQVSQWLYFIIH